MFLQIAEINEQAVKFILGYPASEVLNINLELDKAVKTAT